jgi:hypothetical protein
VLWFIRQGSVFVEEFFPLEHAFLHDKLVDFHLDFLEAFLGAARYLSLIFDSFLELLPALSVLPALPQALASVQATCLGSKRLFGALHDRYASFRTHIYVWKAQLNFAKTYREVTSEFDVVSILRFALIGPAIPGIGIRQVLLISPARNVLVLATV